MIRDYAFHFLRHLQRSLALATVIIVVSTLAHAQDRAADAKPSEREKLEARLATLEKDLAEEEASLEKRQQEQARELAALEKQRGELARRLLTAQANRELNTDRLRDLEATAKQTTVAAEAIAARADSIGPLLQEANEQLHVLLQEIPGFDAALAKVDRLATTFSQRKAGVDGRKALLPAATELFRLLDEVHAQAGRIGVRDVRIFTAADKQEDVRLLSVGLARFAYVTRQDGRAGLALASPSEAAGYRWSESLPLALQNSIHQALATLESGRDATIEFPLDPIGRVEPRSLDKQESLYDTFWLGGPVMIPITFVALLGILLVGERFITLYLRNGGAGSLADEVVALCAAGRIEEARHRCERGRGSVSRVMAACLSRYDAGQRAMEDAIQEQLLHEVPKLQRSLGGIAVLAGVAPMLGLLGTVTGIISTFEAIRAFGAVNPESMAAGISEALIATATGLMIAIPVVILHSMLRGRADGILADAERYAAALLTVLLHGTPTAERRSDPAVEAVLNLPETSDV